MWLYPAALLGFLMSSTMGFGGSLIIAPVAVMVYGSPQGLAISAILLTMNNVLKAIAYRRYIEWKQAVRLTISIAVGIGLGILLLPTIPAPVAMALLVVCCVLTVLCEMNGRALNGNDRAFWNGATMGVISGVLSTVVGTSGPTKGLAIRLLDRPRMQHVAIAASVSLFMDAIKVLGYSKLGYLGNLGISGIELLYFLPLMVIGTGLGFWLNKNNLSESVFSNVWWGIIALYLVRSLGIVIGG